MARHHPGELVTAAWTDIYRQQMRDILLIVIGTLIGVGVTVMIEGLRPLIECLGANPKEKAALEPPPVGSAQKNDASRSSPPQPNSP